jgi:hypothetical protein
VGRPPGDSRLRRGPRRRRAQGGGRGAAGGVRFGGRRPLRDARVQLVGARTAENALDWASRPFATNVLRDKPVAVVGASTGAFGAVWAQAELRKVLATIGARVVEGEVALGHAPQRFDADGRLADEDVREQLAEVVGQLVAAVDARAALAA